MPFHIRHGAPGSYKSACAVWLDCLEWLKQGRKVHTNIRGIGDAADFEMAFGIELPETAEVIPYELRTRQDRLRFAAWFHWLPLGDAIIIDEGQMIYPNRKEFKPEALDLSDDDNPIIPETGERERPSDIFQAIDMHRHFNWDGCVTTPNIKKLPEWFRGSVERAYKHDNRSHISFMGGRTRIISHDPSVAVPAITKGVPVQTLKVPKNVFKVYGSTTTGETTKNIARKNPLKSPALVFPLGVALLASIWTIKGAIEMFGDDDPPVAVDRPQNTVEAVRPDPGGDDIQGNTHVDPVVLAGPSAYDMLSRFLPGASGIFVVGSFGPADQEAQRYLYALVTKEQSVTVSDTWLDDVGFNVQVHSRCAHDITHPLASAPLRVVCRPVQRRETSEAERASGDEGPMLSPLSTINPLGFSMTQAH